MAPSLPLELQIFLSVCAFVLSLAGAYIAFQSWNTARNKLKLDLFERRLTVFEGATNFVGSIVTSGKVEPLALSKYLATTRTTRWVLNESVSQYLSKNLLEPAMSLQHLDAELNAMPVGEERTKNVECQRKIKSNLNAQFKYLDEVFSPFLQLKD